MSAVPGRAVLWVDLLGGYLVCLEPRISVGCAPTHSSPSETTLPDVPLLAPLRPVHVWFHRDTEGYSWHALGPCSCQGRDTSTGICTSNTELVLLTDTCQEACRLRLWLPTPGLLTACLTWQPPVRMALGLRGALLVSRALHLGPDSTAHVRSHLLPETWLFPSTSGWLIRSSVPIVFEKRQHSGELALPPYWQIRLGELYLTLEPVF